jgi:hypothetical protein
MTEYIDEFMTKPVSELDFKKMFEEEFNKELRNVLDRLINLITGYIVGISKYASRWLELNVLVAYSYSYEPDGIKFELKFFLDQQSIEKLKRQVMEKVEKKWVRIKLAEQYLKSRNLEHHT